MFYILMNKQTPLCKLQIDTMDNFIIEDVLEVYNTAAFPIGVDIVAGKPQKKSLAKALAITAGIGGISGAALIALALQERKKIASCCDECLDDFDDDFFADDADDVFCMIDDEDEVSEESEGASEI